MRTAGPRGGADVRPDARADVAADVRAHGRADDAADGTAERHAALVALARLYATLVELRERGAKGEAKPPPAQFRVLATELPGALRILDQMPLEELRARASDLDRAAAMQHAPAPSWAASTLTWQSVMRAALAIRRAAGRERSLVRAREAAASFEWLAARDGDGELEAIVRPEQGRLVVWALGRVGEMLGRPAEAVERDVFGQVRVSALIRGARAPSTTRARR